MGFGNGFGNNFGNGYGRPPVAGPAFSPTFGPTASANDGGLCINCDRTAKPAAPASVPNVVSSPEPVSDLTSTEAETTETCVDCDNGPKNIPSVGQLAKVASIAGCPSSDTDICEMFAGVNEMRREANMPALDYDPTCQAAADVHGRDMASQGFFDHKGSDGSQVDARYRRVSQGARVSALGENIYMVTNMTSSGAALANQTFKNSPGHYQNIISPHFSHVGLARVQGRCNTGGACTYYVQCFSRPAAQ